MLTLHPIRLCVCSRGILIFSGRFLLRPGFSYFIFGHLSSLVFGFASMLHLAASWTSPPLQLLGLHTGRPSESRVLLLLVGLLREPSSPEHDASSRQLLPLIFASWLCPHERRSQASLDLHLSTFDFPWNNQGKNIFDTCSSLMSRRHREGLVVKYLSNHKTQFL
jgi:hypothetical protein